MTNSFPLSQKYRDFINTVDNVDADFLEGTTASGKTTVGASSKFMRMVSRSKKKMHIIASKTTGTAEKNILQQDNGILDIHRGKVKYYGNGDKDYKLPHLKFEGKIIFILGYDNKDKWELVLGSQFGCVYIDEINTANIDFVREMSTRNDYLMATLNPDDPSLPIYKEFINRSRPYKKYAADVPDEIMQELIEEPVPKWRYWFFTFRDNLSLSEEDIKKKIQSAPPGTKLYKNKIQGLRGRATGLILNVEKKNIITLKQAKEFKYQLFSCGVDTSYSRNSDDTFSFIFSGITTCRKKITLAEDVYNNRDLKVPLTPSDIPPLLIKFLEENKKEFGFAKNVFIDNADAGTILECQKYKKHNGCVYVFNPAWKKTQIIDRLNLESGWLAHEDFLIVDTCKESIRERNTYSWKEDKDEPEDGNDHCINADQYSWLPFKDKIGGINGDNKNS
ncbi:terminase large subunit domain-containing protein [Aminipila sp.]|uniref:terminase large subunit domain-containing protein n=1 Tax=Aminipila sp. TaxID=2060095 RepID=UPI002897D14C|nr:terminase family protein [Aminipila sp.]